MPPVYLAQARDVGLLTRVYEISLKFAMQPCMAQTVEAQGFNMVCPNGFYHDRLLFI
jgi:hypothetical protein